jgi:glycosyltransferase involved in cell wall biosynthesis
VIVDQLCTSLSGGASLAAQRLHRSLRTAGVESRFWFSSREKKASSSDEFMFPTRWPQPSGGWGRVNGVLTWCRRKLSWSWAKYRQLRRRPSGFEIFTPARLAADTAFSIANRPGDILHLHWVAKLIDYPSFFASIPDDLPVVWTLHDMNPFTGGCHFSSGCERFMTVCGNCPQLANPGRQDLSNRQFALKFKALRNKNLHVVAPSRWLIEAARLSPILNSARSFHLIPYGLDTEFFFPRDSETARRQFNVPLDATVLGFGADSVANRRKGWRELVEALNQLRYTRPTVALVFGKGELPSNANRNLTIISVGFIHEPSQLANLYSAMDALVMPSLEDNLPQTGLEAMACGTPVIAFDAGGIPDFVLPEQTGLLAKTGDSAALSRQIQRLLDDPERADAMGIRARKLILEQFSSGLESARYLELYRKLLTTRQNPSREAA